MSLISDIDSKKSNLGKVLDYSGVSFFSKFGHRTLTHSFIFCGGCSLVAFGFEYLFFSNYKASLIVGLSILSHIFLDSATVNGVYAFFPRKDIKLVLFNNLNLRLKTGYFKHEALLFLTLAILSILLYPIHKNGISSFISKGKNIIPTTFSIHNSSDYVTYVDYDVNINCSNFSGKGVIVDATKNKIVIFDKGFICIDGNSSVKKLVASKSLDKRLLVKRFTLSSVDFEKVKSLVNGKIILSIDITRLTDFNYSVDEKNYDQKKVHIENLWSPKLKIIKENNVSLLKKKLFGLEKLYRNTESLTEREQIIARIISLRKEITKNEGPNKNLVDVEILEVKTLNKSNSE